MPEEKIRGCRTVPIRSSANILVVDDDEIVRAYLECILSEGGYRVTTSAGFDEAKAALSRRRFDLIVVDLQFLGQSYSGLDIARHAVALHPDCRIIIHTSYPSTQTAVAALRLKAEDYLTKPVGSEDLLSAVGRALDNGDERRVSVPDMTDADLSKKETEVLHLLYKGFSFGEVAQNLGCSHSTAKTHGRRIYRKLEVSSCTEAIHEAIQRGLIDLPI